MSNDEAVDGPKIAAEIISRMKGERKERIVKAINLKAPQLAKKIEDNLIHFELILDLQPPAVQTLMHNINSLDLVLSLRAADAAVREYMIGNLSQRKQALVREELSNQFTGPIEDIKAAQKRILATLEELKTTGKIENKSSKHLWV